MFGGRRSRFWLPWHGFDHLGAQHQLHGAFHHHLLARLQAVGCVRAGGNLGLVGVPHGDLPVNDLFWRNVGVKGGPAHVRAYLPHLLELVLTRTIDPGKVFDLEVTLDEIAEGYKAMDERRAIKAIVRL